jgi:hypothetical protein
MPARSNPIRTSSPPGNPCANTRAAICGRTDCARGRPERHLSEPFRSGIAQRFNLATSPKVAAAEWAVFENSVHVAMVEEPDRYRRVTDVFLAQVEAPAA